MSALFPGSVTQLVDTSAIDVVLVDVNGNPTFGFDASRPANATLTQLAVSTTSVSILAANPARRQAIIYNGSNKVVFIAFTATATTTAYTAQVPIGGSYETPLDGYTGVISGITATAPSAGNHVIVTEVTT